MAHFCVCWNESLRRVRIHRNDCPQLLRSLPKGVDGVRKGRLLAETYDEASRVVRELKRSKPVLRSYGRVECRICNPEIKDIGATEASAHLQTPEMCRPKTKSA